MFKYRKKLISNVSKNKNNDINLTNSFNTTFALQTKFQNFQSNLFNNITVKMSEGSGYCCRFWKFEFDCRLWLFLKILSNCCIWYMLPPNRVESCPIWVATGDAIWGRRCIICCWPTGCCPGDASICCCWGLAIMCCWGLVSICCWGRTWPCIIPAWFCGKQLIY